MDAAAIGPEFAPARRPEIAWVELDGEVVVYQESSTSTMVLNATASLLWQLFDGSSTLASIACEMADAYDAAAEDIEHDLVVAARELGAFGLLDGVSTDSGEEP